MDPATVIPEEYSKDLLGHPLAIDFKASNIQQVDPDLVEFIRVNTGKIRPLATADLESYITLGQELLNIGKPFYLEGIGTLTKTQDGRLEFSPGEFTSTRLEDSSTEKGDRDHCTCRRYYQNNFADQRFTGGEREGCRFIISRRIRSLPVYYSSNT
jgi:hypothetical protein